MNLNESEQFSQCSDLFQGLVVPEKSAVLAGYTALMRVYQLVVPMPDIGCIIGAKHKNYEEEFWRVFGPRYLPKATMYGHLVFALKYEGVNLSILSALFEVVPQENIEDIVRDEPNGIYSRRIWFLYEWITGKKINCDDIQDKKIRYTKVLDPKLQFEGPSRRSQRHHVDNNLPGVRSFCPLIRRTKALTDHIDNQLNLSLKTELKELHPDLLMRAAAFLLLEDSKASYAIEGESPALNRAQRWGQAIGQAGKNELTHDEFLRLQEIVIRDFRYTHPGYRIEGGFIGQHDRVTHHPIPSHISAKHEDIYDLMGGVIETDKLLTESDYHAVLAAASIAFGMVFIHPFEDGNGRVHRYLIHHVLIKKNFTPDGLIFPISHVILQRLSEYRAVLESFSLNRLEFIKWRPTEKGNVEVLNDTIDLYRYFDATKQAEFLFSCIQETIQTVLPNEIKYLKKHDEMKLFIDNYIEMPDRMVSLLIKFLNQENGRLSKRAREKEFCDLSDQEIETIESKYNSIFNKNYAEIERR